MSIVKQVEAAREHALLGNYNAACVGFESVLRQLAAEVEAVGGASTAAGVAWEGAVRQLREELSLVRSVRSELSCFASPPGRARRPSDDPRDGRDAAFAAAPDAPRRRSGASLRRSGHPRRGVSDYPQYDDGGPRFI